ncbi:MAG: hypothetical protein FWD05_00505 [Oscillospiraceae bacterium]|nr:hypothetical protein [Oscillospiraceae bacterium]
MQNHKNVNTPYLSDNNIRILFTLICVIALLVVRGALFYYQSGDFLFFLQPWVEEYRTMTFLEGLRINVGTYNPPYMYIINIIARINISELYLIKIVSVIFDFFLAYFVMKIVSLKTSSANMKALAFLAAFAIPTVILNGAMWGQCDSIYATFAIGSFYFGLRGRSKMSYAFMALAFAFKLQAVFLLPMIPVFIFMNRLRLRDCYVFFVVYIATLMPAIIAGMPIADALLAYVVQANFYSMLNLNIVNMWRFFEHVPYENFRLAGIYFAGFAVLSLMYFTYVNRKRLIKTVDYVRLAYLFAVIMPFLLPKMHDRYYFIADVLAVTVFFYDKRRWYVPVVTITCSFLAYAFFLMFGVELLDYRLAAFALLVVIIIVLRDFVMSIYPSKNEPSESVVEDV